jgi:phosphoglycolate phosphatase-like HAD superfamily hydrolase
MTSKAFIFDWSGTLSDNFHLFCKVCDLIFTELGKEPIFAEEIKLHFTLPYMKFWNRYFPNLTREKQCSLYEKYIHQVGEPKLYKKVDEIIAYLKRNGYLLFILSSDPISKLLPEIKKSGFAELITKTVGDVHDKKDTIISFINDFSLDKKLTYYVGDTSGDVEAGQFAGVKTIGISWGFQHKNVLSQAKPDFLIDDIIEIKDIIRKA